MDDELHKRRERELLEGKAVEQTSDELADEMTSRQLREGLDLLEATIHVPTPSAAWFDQQIAATQSKRKSRLVRDLVILWISAMLLFYVFYLTVTSKPVAFLSIQAAAILVPLAWLILRKQVDAHDTN
ncbi:YxlC family protein [Paenibacillus qinlingensis]|uniref:YxlC family protein n=1 Tax=Paenibacillus qinlingensis TaxID=1837343 RepID=UPI0015650874|nr:YxlC family protein [Paenibacillus qinlingensis]NQX63155.1 YxlC family protein [Paenibacillus qinlingensis]